MKLSNEIKNFHERINYQLEPLPISVLKSHKINVDPMKKAKKTQLKIRAFHFTVLSIERCVDSSAMVFNQPFKWKKIGGERLYYEKELTEFALQCLYLMHIPLGECVVQRTGKKEMIVIKIRPIEVTELTAEEQEVIFRKIRREKEKQVTFGADLELMIRNKKTKKYVDGGAIKNKQIGFDDAIALNNHRVYHPIFEVRPDPSVHIHQLHKNLNCLYSTVIKETSKYQYETVVDAHPKQRFFLGGHLHFGNVRFTFQDVASLDMFLAIPLSLIERKPSLQRRSHYGRLGSVRANPYDGFEYRVLSTWFSLIPNALPILQWIEFIINNTHKINITKLKQKEIYNYYNNEKSEISIDDWARENKDSFQDVNGSSLFIDYIACLKKLKGYCRDL